MTDSEHIVRHERKPLSAEQIARLKAAADRSDEEIDFSDIPDADAGSATLRAWAREGRDTTTSSGGRRPSPGQAASLARVERFARQRARAPG